MKVNTVKPITPAEATKLKLDNIPPEVIAIFNEHIACNLNGSLDGTGKARVDQNEVMADIQHTLGVERNVIFENHWLDVENIYRDAGWLVTYHSPDYTESFPSYYIFEAK